MEVKKIKLKEKELEAIQWKDNLSEMKRFCLKNCTITYETCCIDDYWLLVVLDRDGNEIGVPLQDWVVKLGEDEFIVVSNEDFNEYFEICNQ